tara:strand:- start:3029 stop:3178 length:150 start_codon:yes stop_codon:yes gene_type:complete
MVQIQLDYGIALILFLWILNPTKKNNEKECSEGIRSIHVAGGCAIISIM